MDRAVAAVHHHVEVARIVARIGRHAADRVRHVRVDDPEDPVRGRHQVEPERHAHLREDRLAYTGLRQLELTAAQRLGVDVAEHEVRVGDGRARAAAAVADRTGVGLRALRADAQHARLHRRDRAAARADRVHLDHRQSDEVAVLPVPEAADRGRAAAHEARLVARAAHVDRDEVRNTRARRDRARADHAAGRPGSERGNRALGELFRGHDPAVALHDQQIAAVAPIAQRALEPVEIAGELRTHVGIHERRRRALELRRGRHHLVGERDARLRVFLGDDLAHALLVGGIQEREQEAHRDRLDALAAQPAHRLAHRVLVERRHHRAAEIEPLGNAEAVAPARDRRRRRERRIPDVLLEAAADVDLVAVALRGEQAGLRAVHLDHRVVGGGGAVHDEIGAREERSRVEAVAAREQLDSVHDAAALVVERSRHLEQLDSAVGQREDEVGERATDVDADPEAHLYALARSRSALVPSWSTARASSSRLPVNTTP